MGCSRDREGYPKNHRRTAADGPGSAMEALACAIVLSRYLGSAWIDLHSGMSAIKWPFGFVVLLSCLVLPMSLLVLVCAHGTLSSHYKGRSAAVAVGASHAEREGKSAGSRYRLHTG